MDLYSITYLQLNLYRPPYDGSDTSPHGYGLKFYGSEQTKETTEACHWMFHPGMIGRSPGPIAATIC